MDHPTLMLAPEVAAILGVEVATLPAKWRRLHGTSGFPRPLPGRPDAWSRVLVEEWIATPAGEASRRVARAGSRREDAVARQRQALEARYAPGAHAHG